MNTINIKSIEVVGNAVKATVMFDDVKEVITTTIGEKYAKNIVTDRIDAYVWGFMGFAMQLGANIVSDIPISESLFYNLTYHFIPTVSQEREDLNLIKISAPLIKDIETSGEIVATGISCGVDSLYTIMNHTKNDVPASHKINTLVFLNAGSSMKGGDVLRTPLVRGRLELAEKFAAEYKYNFLFIEPDIHLLINRYIGCNHVRNHSYMMLFCIYYLQSVVGKYYYSSGYSYGNFHFGEYLASYDLLTFAMATIGKMRFFSTGGDVERLDKTLAIADYVPAQKFLNVCVDDVKNCSKCFKCVRTMLTLDGLNVLDKFGDVFDVEQYRKERFWYLKELYTGAVLKNNIYSKEIYHLFKNEFTLWLS